MNVKGLIDTLSAARGALDSSQQKILQLAEQLSGADVEAAWRMLEQAARSESERESLLRDARFCFNRAISLEHGCRLAWAWFGLALAHCGLGDNTNGTAALLSFVAVEPDEPGLIDYFLDPWTGDERFKAARQCRAVQHEVRKHLIDSCLSGIAETLPSALGNQSAKVA
jgi:hypothetical protein